MADNNHERITIHLAKDQEESRLNKGRYSSIDKPYNQFYGDDNLHYEVPKKTIWQQLKQAIERNPDDIALIWGNQRIRFDDFRTMIETMAKSLAQLGIGRNDIVASIITNVPQSVALLYATSYVGAIFAAMDPRDSEREMQQKLDDAHPKCFFIFEGFDKLSRIDVDAGMKIIVLGESDDGSAMSFNDFLKLGENAPLIDEAEYEDGHCASLVYTGASTGAAKGVMLTDHSFNAMGYEWVKSGYEFGRNKILLDVLPQFIAYGVCNALHVPLMWGQTVKLVDPLRIDLFPQYMAESEATHVYCSPVHIRFLKMDPTVQDIDLSRLELLASGGAGMPLEEDIENYQWFKAHGAPTAYGQGYGLTEINAAFCYGNGDKNRPGYIGLPLAGNDAVIVDPETKVELPYGKDQQGLLMIQTETTMKGYFGPAAKRDDEIFAQDDKGRTWIATGDICTMDEQGHIRIIDRVGRGFNCLGMNIYPAVIEEVLAIHPQVKESVVTGLEHEVLGHAPIAHVVVTMDGIDDFEALADELDEIIANELPEYTKLYAYDFRAELPYSSRGKPDYQLIETQGVSGDFNNAIIQREAI